MACCAHGISRRTWGMCTSCASIDLLCAPRPHLVPPRCARKGMGAHLPVVGAHQDFVHEPKSCADLKIVCMNQNRARIRRACARLFKVMSYPKSTPKGLRSHAPRIRPPKDVAHTEGRIRARYRLRTRRVDGRTKRSKGAHAFSCAHGPWDMVCGLCAPTRSMGAHDVHIPPCAPRNATCGTAPENISTKPENIRLEPENMMLERQKP
jgi:hypothetical protein